MQHVQILLQQRKPAEDTSPEVYSALSIAGGV